MSICIKAALAVATIVGTAITAGCTTMNAQPEFSPSKPFDGKLVSGTVTMQCSYITSCQSFLIDVKNKTNADVDIDWNKSLYVKDGQTDGGLYFDGIVVAQRNAPRAPDVIFAEMSLKKTVVPNNSLTLSLMPLAHWVVQDLQGKTNGVMLTFKSKSEEERIRVDFQIK